MKVVVTAMGDGLDAEVDPRFGRAAKLVTVDTETGEWTSIDNAAGVQAAHGAGIQAAEAVSRSGATGLITGHCGPKAYSALTAAGITVYTGASGTVREAVSRFQAGGLTPAAGADVGGRH